MARHSSVPDGLGQQVLDQRRAGTPWKVLCEETGYGRTRLWQLMTEAEAAEADPAAAEEKCS